eukprot:scaffold399_cov115-Pinguiococcus_pyrenoidosus.AAC.1
MLELPTRIISAGKVAAAQPPLRFRRLALLLRPLECSPAGCPANSPDWPAGTHPNSFLPPLHGYGAEGFVSKSAVRFRAVM